MEVAATHTLQENCTQKDCQLRKGHSGLIKHVPTLGTRRVADYKYAGRDGPYSYLEVKTVLKDAIGIDPDSKGFVCSFVELKDKRIKKKEYLATQEHLQNLINWIQEKGDVIVAIEGKSGQSKPLEKALRKAEIVFYSFRPSDVSKFRKAVLGQNKNNERDAESVARYAMALEAQGKLSNWKRVWFPDEELQMLTRSYERTSKELTAELNRLWKLIRTASVDLYLALGGNNSSVKISWNMLKSQGVLKLLAEKPDICEWKTLSETDLLKAMGERNYKGRRELVQELKKVSQSFEQVSPSLIFMIRNGVQKILFLKGQLTETMNMLKVITKDNKSIKALEEYKGISTLTASTLVSEIINVKRFATNDSLACYAGLGMKEHSTGNNPRQVPSSMYNHRLKDTFMTAAKNYVHYNPGSHLTGYYRNLVKRGMSITEARKRVARALVRVVFKRLNALTDEKYNTAVGEEKIKRESGMASGITRSEIIHMSDIPPLSLLKNYIEVTRKSNMKNCEQKLKSHEKILEEV